MANAIGAARCGSPGAIVRRAGTPEQASGGGRHRGQVAGARMILPNVRMSFGRAEAGLVIGLLAKGEDSAVRERAEERLREEGFDSLLDDPRTLNAVMTAGGLASLPATLVFYLLVRHTLLEQGFGDRTVADYLTALLMEYGRGSRAYRVEAGDTAELRYLADHVDALSTAQGRRVFLIEAHLGELSLWLSGLFPDWIEHRRNRRGSPGLSYYEEMGSSGYRRAAGRSDADRHGIAPIYRSCAENFGVLRVALNRVSDRHFFPGAGDGVARLLRRVRDDYRPGRPTS